MTKKKENLMVIFILLLPFIDFITGILTWEGIGYSIGLIIKGIFLIYIIFYLLKNYPNKKIFLLMGLYFFIYLLYIFTNGLNIKVELTNIIKIFYLPTLILFFSNYKNDLINKKTLSLVMLFYLLLYLIPGMFGIGHNLNEVYNNKYLYLSFFYIGNELINIFIVLIPVTICYLSESNSYLLKIFYGILLIIASLILSTKAYYLSLGIILIYFLVVNSKKMCKFIKMEKLKSLLFIVAILAGLIVYIPKMDLVKNIEVSLDHYNINNTKELFTIENIDHIVFSNRLTFLNNVNENYKNSKGIEKLMGLSRESINEIKDVEIDVFDIFYSIGIIGFSFYLIFFIFVLKQARLKNVYKLSFILTLVISNFSGHVLLSPMVTTYLALLFIVSNNDLGVSKKNILLVSNMYPSNKYPHYGIFVKNGYDILKENYDIDLVVMTKKDNFVSKLFSYIKLCGSSFLKVIFNNYDYIYVHFASHSTVGVIIPYLFLKNTKLVINVHGNDIVADTKEDKKYLWISKFCISHATQIIAPSNYFKNILIKDYKVAKNKIVVYPASGVNHEIFEGKNKTESLKKAGLKSGIKYFSFVARIEKDKGYDTLILAINELKKEKKLENIKFIIVGSGSEESILNDLINKYKVSKYIIRKPLLSQNELVNIYNASEAFLYPTRRKSESLGLTGLEAMACGTLVIGSNKYGPSDYLTEKNSIPFDPTSELELAKNIEKVLKMKAKEKNVLTKEAIKTSYEYDLENTKDVLLETLKK